MSLYLHIVCQFPAALIPPATERTPVDLLLLMGGFAVGAAMGAACAIRMRPKHVARKQPAKPQKEDPESRRQRAMMLALSRRLNAQLELLWPLPLVLGVLQMSFTLRLSSSIPRIGQVYMPALL